VRTKFDIYAFITLAYKILEEKFEEIKGIIIRRKSKKERQYNDKKKRDRKRQTMVHKNITQKT